MIAKIKKILLGLATPLLMVSVMVSPTASADTTPAATKDPCNTGVTFFPRWYDGLCKDGTIVSPNDMNTGGSDEASTTGNKLGAWITLIALNIVSMLLYAVGYVSLGFIIFGGFKYMTSGDNSSGTAAARKTILNAVIGLVLSIMSVGIIKFIAGAVGAA